MSHFDKIKKIPSGFTLTGQTSNSDVAAFENSTRKIYCTLFHPEVVHTQFGDRVLINFLKSICGLKTLTKPFLLDCASYTEKQVNEIRSKVFSGKAICALSGGVDSAVSAFLAHKA